MTDQQNNRPTILQLDKCASWQEQNPAINKLTKCSHRNVWGYNWRWTLTMLLDNVFQFPYKWHITNNEILHMTNDKWQVYKTAHDNLQNDIAHTLHMTPAQYTNLTNREWTKKHTTSEQPTTIHLDKFAIGDIANGCHWNVQTTQNSCTFLENALDTLAFHIWQLWEYTYDTTTAWQVGKGITYCSVLCWSVCCHLFVCEKTICLVVGVWSVNCYFYRKHFYGQRAALCWTTGCWCVIST